MGTVRCCGGTAAGLCPELVPFARPNALRRPLYRLYPQRHATLSATDSASVSVTDCGGLENRYGPDWSIEGSNPSPSAHPSERPATSYFPYGSKRSQRGVPAEDQPPSGPKSPGAGTSD